MPSIPDGIEISGIHHQSVTKISKAGIEVFGKHTSTPCVCVYVCVYIYIYIYIYYIYRYILYIYMYIYDVYANIVIHIYAWRPLISCYRVNVWYRKKTFSINVPSLYFVKHHNTSGFLMFSGAVEVEHWLKMG